MAALVLALVVSGIAVTLVSAPTRLSGPAAVLGTTPVCAQQDPEDSEDDDEEGLDECCTVDRHWFRWPPWCVDVTITCDCPELKGTIHIDNARCLF